MKKEDLIAMGLSEEQATKVMGSLDGNYVTKVRFNEINEENKNLKKSVGDRDKQLEDLKKSAGDNSDLQKQIADLQKTNADLEKTHQTEMNQLKVNNAVEQVLTGAKAKNTKAVKALLDLTDAKLADDGSVVGLKEQIEKLTADESTKFLFDVAETTPAQQTTFTGFQPGVSTTVPNSTQAGYETRLAEARQKGNQLEVIKIKQEAFDSDGIVLM